jgi:hypothetical protein
MRKVLFILSILTINIGLFGQTGIYRTGMMNFQKYSNGVPSGKPSISSRNDTITITTNDISITNYVYGSKKTSTFRITSVENNVYTCQVGEFESYKVYIKDNWVVVERYSGKELFAIRKYLIKPANIK